MLLLFLSAPSQVQNVRVSTFLPIRGENSIISCKVMWTRLTMEQAGGIVEKYQITLLNTTSQNATEVICNNACLDIILFGLLHMFSTLNPCTCTVNKREYLTPYRSQYSVDVIRDVAMFTHPQPKICHT